MIVSKLQDMKKEGRGAKASIAAYLLESKDVVNLNASQVANDCYISNSYITKFAKDLGYKNFDNMRLDLIRDVEFASYNVAHTESFEITDYANEVLNTLVRTTNYLCEASLHQVVDRILGCDQVILYGIGSSSIPCEDLYYKLLKLNYNVKFEKDESIRGMISGNATAKSIALIFSYSGPSDKMQDCIKKLKKNNAYIVLITMSEQNFKEDLKLKLFSSEDFERPYSIYSRISMNFISDILYIYLRKRTILPKE